MSLSTLTWFPLRRVLAIVTRCQHLLETVRNPYRPELYYMRGPGPKWHAKHRMAG